MTHSSIVYIVTQAASENVGIVVPKFCSLQWFLLKLHLLLAKGTKMSFAAMVEESSSQL